MPLLPGRRRPEPSAQGPLIPATITATSPAVLCLVDGAATAISVKTGKGWTPVIGDRVGLIQFGSQYLAISVG